MSKMLSTLDVPVWRVNVENDVPQGTDTHNALFAQEDGHLLIQELVKEDFAECPTMEFSSSAEKETMRARYQSVRLPRVHPVSMSSNDRYILLKKYDGFVTSRGERSFAVRLFENASDYPVVEAEFDLEELSETDRTLAVEGAALVWTIGYRYEGNTRKRESVIYLRRLPPWSEKEIAQCRKEAEQLTHGIQWK